MKYKDYNIVQLRDIDGNIFTGVKARTTRKYGLLRPLTRKKKQGNTSLTKTTEQQKNKRKGSK